MIDPQILPKVQRIGMVARWQPVHLGHIPVLKAMCACADRAYIGIGSSNMHDFRTPFYLDETREMIRLVLAGRDNYTLIPVPDLHNGPRWREMILQLFGPLDLFVTENAYVASLLKDDYALIHPVQLVPENEKIAVNGTMVRQAMARGKGWQDWVPPVVAEYLVGQHLDDRFRSEFGLQTLAMGAMIE